MNFLRILSVLLVVMVVTATVSEAAPLLNIFRPRGRGRNNRRGNGKVCGNGVHPRFGDAYAGLADNGILNANAFLCV